MVLIASPTDELPRTCRVSLKYQNPIGFGNPFGQLDDGRLIRAAEIWLIFINAAARFASSADFYRRAFRNEPLQHFAKIKIIFWRTGHANS